MDELLIYVAPSLLGDSGAGMFNLPGIARLDQKLGLRLVDVQRIGADLRIVARL